MVNVIISSDPRYPVSKVAIQSAVLNVLTQNHLSGRVEVEVNIVGDRKMHELNRYYRKIDSTTDILTFAFQDPNPQGWKHQPQGWASSPDNWLRLGSIVISYPEAQQDASMDNRTVEDEISFLVEHGTNHLLGHHH